MRPDAALCGLRYTAAEKASAIRMYKAGVFLPDICAAIGVSRTNLRRWIKAACIPLRKPGFPCTRPEITNKVANDLWRQHGSIRAAAEAVGMSRSTFEKRAYYIHFVTEPRIQNA